MLKIDLMAIATSLANFVSLSAVTFLHSPVQHHMKYVHEAAL